MAQLIERFDRFIHSIGNRKGEPDYHEGHSTKQALPDTADEVRPLAPVTRNSISAGLSITAEALNAFRATETYSDLLTYFANYPPRSLMSDESRATLYSLIHMLRPKVVVEIGTFFAGTTEVMARALWENGEGVIHTTDPHGGERCHAIISSWPSELRTITHFHPLNSMGLFGEFDRRQISLDLVLVDGHHDYEYALFDLQMAARRLRPGGIIVMDNSSQTGPFYASKTFLAAHPAWQEIGNAIATYCRFRPFDGGRTSLPGTSFIVLQAPKQLAIDATPQSSGQKFTNLSVVKAVSIDLPAQVASGILYCQVFLRTFADNNKDVRELQSLGNIRLDLRGEPMSFPLKLTTPLRTVVQLKYDEVTLTYEIDLSWQADDRNAPPLFLSSQPTPLSD
jgi:predicted O-methyltransferase YrrM